MKMNELSDLDVKAIYNRVIFLFVVFVFMINAQGQDVQFTRNNNSTVSVDSDIDPSSLGLAINVRLANYPGRSGNNIPINLKYSSKVWNIEYEASEELPSEPGRIYTYARARYENGWSSSLFPPTFTYYSAGSYFDEYGKDIDVTELYYKDGTPKYESYFYVPRMAIRMPDGSIHELRKGDWKYEKFLANPNPIPQWVYDGTYYAVDGSQIKYNTSNGTIYLPDGSRYISETYQGNFIGVFHTYIDRNGNTIKYSAEDGGWKDTIGRTVPIPALMSETVQDTTYTVKGINNSNLSFTFRWRRLADVRTDPNAPLRYAGDQANPYFPTTLFSPSLFTSDETCVCNYPDAGVFNPIVLHEIVLPNGSSYKFNYNIWGEIDKLTYPSGGYERFRYDKVAGTSFVSNPYAQANRGVVEKWVSTDGNPASEIRWQYTNEPVTPTTGWYQYVTVVAPDNTKTERLFHSAGYGGSQFGFEDPKVGLLAEERVYDSAGLMIRRRLKDYAVSGPFYDQLPYGGSQVPNARRNPLVSKESEILLDIGSNPPLVSTNTFSYDSDLNVITSTEHNFAEVSSRNVAETAQINNLPLGTVYRTANFDYLRGGAYSEIKGLQTLMTITDGAGRLVEKTETLYDEASLQSYGGQPVGWVDPLTNVRGNPTTLRRWIDGTNYVDVHSTYDIFGNEITVSNGLGDVATLQYSSTYQYAYQTKVITPAPDPNGVTGSAAQMESSINFDFTTGTVLSRTDPNGNTTTYEHVDPMDRLTRINSSDGGWTSFSYGDTPNNFYLHKQMSQDANQSLETYEYFDGLMRLKRKSSNEGETWSIVDTEYDSTGREWRHSNSYRDTVPNNSTPPSRLWTTKQYDALDRISTVTAPDGSVSTTVYSGNTVVVTDPAGKAVKSIADMKGNNLQVIEAPNSANPYVTNYTYDALSNLRTVTQTSAELGVTQTRYFMYDMLDRLIRVKNPEENANPNLNIPDPITGNSSWSRSFTYDNDDNVKVTQDARGVITNCDFDRLSRKTQCSYITPSGVAATPIVNYFYDGVEVGGFQNSLGNLTRVASSTATLNVNELDPLGRVKKTTQVIDQNSYIMQYAYDLAGHIVSQTYPSGRVVANTFDRAARLKEVTGQTPSQPISKTYVSNIAYAPHWGMLSMKLGNSLREQVEFNNNLQKVKVKLGHSLGDSSLVKIENSYTAGGLGNNGNLRQQIISFGSQTITQDFTFDNYDRLYEAKENGGSSWKQRFIYDRFGNRTLDPQNTTSGFLGPNPAISAPKNQLQNHSYDSSGNLTSDPEGHSYLYDANNLLASYDNGYATYIYDGNGRRVKKTVDGITTYYVYNVVGQMVAEYTTGTPSQDGTRFLTSDHTGSARVLTDSFGQVKERRDYLPFGEDVGVGVGGRTPAQGYGVDSPITQKFTGKERDKETGFDFFGARYYTSSSGRFTTPDPLIASANISDPQSWNRYAYVTNNPMKYIDIGGFLKRDKNTGKLEFDSSSVNFSDPSTWTLEHDGNWKQTWTGRWGTLKTDKGNDIRAFYNNRGGDMGADTDCHGLTFADGEYWINNDQVQTILDDEYTEVKNEPARVGDVVVYYDSKVDENGNPKEGGNIVHSATVTAVDEKGNVTEVSGIGGIRNQAQSTTRDAQFSDTAPAKGRARTSKVFKKNNITEEERKKNADRAKGFDKAKERQKKKDEEEKKKKEKEEEKRKKKQEKKMKGRPGSDASEIHWQPEA